MDEYAEYIYKRRPDYRTVEPGDLTKQLEFRKRMKCKPFKWFMETIAFDQPEHYPPIEPEDYAKGYIKNVKHSDFCVDDNTRYHKPGERYVWILLWFLMS